MLLLQLLQNNFLVYLWLRRLRVLCSEFQEFWYLIKILMQYTVVFIYGEIFRIVYSNKNLRFWQLRTAFIQQLKMCEPTWKKGQFYSSCLQKHAIFCKKLVNCPTREYHILTSEFHVLLNSVCLLLPALHFNVKN